MNDDVKMIMGNEIIARKVQNIKPTDNNDLTGDAIQAAIFGDNDVEGTQISLTDAQDNLKSLYGITDEMIESGDTADLFDWLNIIAGDDGDPENLTLSELTKEYEYVETDTDEIDEVDEADETDEVDVTDETEPAEEYTSMDAMGFKGRSVEDGKIIDDGEGNYTVSVDAWNADESSNIDCASRLVYNVYGVSMYSDEGQEIYNRLLEANPEIVGQNGEMSLHPGQTINLVKHNDEADSASNQNYEDETVYDANGNITQETTYDEDGGRQVKEKVTTTDEYTGISSTYYQVTEYGPSSDNPSSITKYSDSDYSNKTSETIYDEDGNYEMTFYNSDGQPSTLGKYDADGNLKEATSYHYDENDLLSYNTAIINEDGSKTVTKYDANGNITQETTYDKDGGRQVKEKVTTTDEYTGISSTYYQVTEYGPSSDNPSSITKYSDSDYSNKTSETIYDEDGNYEMTFYNSDGNPSTLGKYDADGNLKEATSYHYDENNAQSGYNTAIINEDGSKTVTKYDGSGTALNVTVYDANGNITQETTYDENGNIILPLR